MGTRQRIHPLSVIGQRALQAMYSMNQLVKVLKSLLKMFLGQCPLLILPYMRQFHPNAAVTTETDIVIEGFPRSANSFSVRSLRISHQSPVKIAHHLHIPAQLIFGVKRGIPTLLLLRNPLEAVTSLCIYEPRISPTVGLLGYILFYSPLKPYKEKMVIADFDTVTLINLQ